MPTYIINHKTMVKRYELGQFVTTNYPILKFTPKLTFEIIIWPIVEPPVKLYFAGVHGVHGSEG